MPAIASIAAPNVGDALRHLVELRCRRIGRSKLLGAAAIAVLVIISTAAFPPPVLLVWNASASAPLGLYWVEHGAAVRRGDMVIAWAPNQARSLAAMRGYLPADVPLVKRVAAGHGDRVCGLGRFVWINGSGVASRLERDGSGRPMPRWNGCRTLGPRDYFLLTNSPLSFDGRYFGISDEHDILGRAILLWAQPSKAATRA